MNFQLVIVNAKTNTFMSTVKSHSPKMLNMLKEIASKYSVMFGTEYKVKRVISTKQGWKMI